MALRYLSNLLILLISAAPVHRSLHAQDITLFKQTEVNAFDPGITVINGSLFISSDGSSDPITSLLPLGALEEVTGDITISDCNMSDFAGLNALRIVGRDFTIIRNKRLKNLDALSILTTVGRTFLINGHDSLTSISGMDALNAVGGHLEIEKNKGLMSINGFNQVTMIGGDIVISENKNLSEINGINGIITTVGDLIIKQNYPLSAIHGFQHITQVKGDLTLSDSKMTELNFLTNLDSIGGTLKISWNNDLVEIPDLIKLKYTGGLSISHNDGLTDIAGFNGLIGVQDLLSINGNLITQITGFRNLRSAGDLFITSNNLLKDIFGFSTFEFGTQITFTFNPLLENFEGFSQLKSISGHLAFNVNVGMRNVDGFLGLTQINLLEISRSDNLINLDGFSNLTSLTDLNIITCDRLEVINLPRVREMDEIYISNCNSLKTLNLPELDSIHDFVLITSTAIEDVNGLSNLEFVNNNFSLTHNEMLVHLNGLKNLLRVGGTLHIGGNIVLYDCCGIYQLLASPDAVGGSTEIGGNDTGCDSNAEVITNSKCGHVINDFNGDCIWDPNETRLPGRFAILTPGKIILTSNAAGTFDLSDLVAGQYTLQIDTSGPWSTSCSNKRTFEITHDGAIPEFDPFLLFNEDPCSVPTISVDMPAARRCFENQQIVIQACNGVLATGAIPNAFVILTLDSLLTFQSSTVPATPLGSNSYRFEIQDLYPLECATIQVEVKVSCDAILGQSLCLKAELTPVDTCIFNEESNTFTAPNTGCVAAYQGSHIAVSGHCETDSVYFKIENLTDLSTECYLPLRLFQDELLILKDSIFLEGHQAEEMAFFADGRTLRLEADQHPHHPGLSRPNSTVDFCGNPDNWTPGARSAFYQDDLSSVIDIHCVEVRGSYDPNDKNVTPLGLGENHYILPDEPLDYTIRFQNTGNDTAFTVVIRDTLDTDLNIFSVVPGASSHSYNFKMYGPGVLEWEFQNILLPDSTTNESSSHGFVSFQVKQQPNLPVGTILSNRAGIYFDFNEPVITNEVTQVVNNLDELISSTDSNLPLTSKPARITPNPSGGIFDLVFDEVQSEIQIQMFNSTGCRIQTGQYVNTNMIHLSSATQPGFYFVHVSIPGKSFVLKAVVR